MAIKASITLEELREKMGMESDKTQYPKVHKNIYELGVYEITQVQLTKDLWIGVTRVPGGWIHMFKGHPVFVPYSDEFKGKFTGEQYGI